MAIFRGGLRRTLLGLQASWEFLKDLRNCGGIVQIPAGKQLLHLVIVYVIWSNVAETYACGVDNPVLNVLPFNEEACIHISMNILRSGQDLLFGEEIDSVN